MRTPPSSLILTGNVHPSKPMFALVGDVAIHPGASNTRFIDATIFDGSSWRALDLGGFGFRKGDRVFDSSVEIGPRMRQIEQSIKKCKGANVYYEVPFGSKKRKYVYKGVSIASIFGGQNRFF